MHLSLVFSFPFPSPSAFASLRLCASFALPCFGSLALSARFAQPPTTTPQLAPLGVFSRSSLGGGVLLLLSFAPPLRGGVPPPSQSFGARGTVPRCSALCICPRRGAFGVSTPPPLKGGRPLRVYLQQNKKGRLPRTYLLCCCVWSLRTRSRSLPTQKRVGTVNVSGR